MIEIRLKKPFKALMSYCLYMGLPEFLVTDGDHRFPPRSGQHGFPRIRVWCGDARGRPEGLPETSIKRGFGS
jgi:hypothetical protein